MDPKSQSSFIPKKPLVPGGGLPRYASINFFLLGASLIFVLAIAGSIGVYVWQHVIETKIAQDEQSLARTKQEFDPALIDTLSKLDSRLQAAKDILNNHIAISSFFDLLQTITLKSVRFTSFNYTLVGKDKINITLSGEGQSFSSIALQSDVFGQNKLLKDPIVSNLSLQQNGSVGFDFTASLDPKVALYKNSSMFQPAATGTVQISTSTPQ